MVQAVIDLNADMGESFGNYQLGMDGEVIKYISSANIACGFHAGDPKVMDYTVKIAAENGVGVGAHPGFPDLVGFGRRQMDINPEDVTRDVIYQIGALQAVAKSRGVKLQHVKAHGALNNMASTDYELALAIGRAIKAVDDQLIYVALAGSAMYRAAKELGLRVAGEGFADRAYNPDGTLVSRKKEGAVIHDPDEVVRRVMEMAHGTITAVDGTKIVTAVDTICVHGDNPRAVDLVRYLKTELEKNGVAVKPMQAFID